MDYEALISKSEGKLRGEISILLKVKGSDHVKVLFLNGDHPWEGQDGYYKLTRQILSMLNKEHDVHLFVLAGSKVKENAEKYDLASMNVLFKARKNKKISQIRSFASRDSMVTWQFKYKGIVDRVNETIEQIQPDVIILNHLRSAWIAPYLSSSAKMIYVAHNAEAHAIGSISTNEKGMMKRLTHLESEKLSKMEAEVLEAVDTCVTLTHEDRERLRHLNSNITFDVIPPPIQLPKEKNEMKQPNLLLVGSYKWYPKRKNALWLAKEVLPLVSEKFPTITLKFVGEAASVLEEELGQHENIEYHTDVPEIKPYMLGGDIFLVPERQEGGIKIKTLEAASYGLPIISTKAGLEGTTLVNGSSILEANTAQQFADQISTLLTHPTQLHEIAASARAAIERTFQAEKIQAQYEDLLQSHRVLDTVR
ncbi:glycosyltransferase [Bacillus sp. N1-1]|nr:glycosyltransferase [Bacillus sp. N1-1]